MLQSVARLASAVLVVAAGLAVGIWSIGFAWSIEGISRAATSTAASVLLLAAGGSLLVAGTIGTWRRPRLPGAPLLVLAALGWFSPSGRARPHRRRLSSPSVSWPERHGRRSSRTRACVSVGRRSTPRSVRCSLAGYVVGIGLLGRHPDDRVRAACGRLHGLPGQPARLADVTRADGGVDAARIRASRPCGLRRWPSCSAAASAGRRGPARRLGLAVQLPALVCLAAVAADGLHSVSRGSLSNDRLDIALWAVVGRWADRLRDRGDAAASPGTWRAAVDRAHRARCLGRSAAGRASANARHDPR